MLSIVIVNYNTRTLLQECLRSLAVHCPAAEVIVVDNASRDGSVEMVRSDFPAVQMIALDRNVGFAGANNVGLRHASGEFLLLLNSDTYVEDDSLTRCAAWMQAHPEVGAASPRLIGFDGVPQPCAHPFPTFRDRLLQSFWLAPDRAEPDAETLAGWLIGAALMIRRDALMQAGGGLDAGYFMYWEDTDFSAQLRRAGWKLSVYLDGHVCHRGGGSSEGGDGIQRPELYACFVSGKYQWFGRYRPQWERVGIWLLDAMDVGRKFLRSIVRPSRRADYRRSLTLAWTLWNVLRGRGQPARI